MIIRTVLAAAAFAAVVVPAQAQSDDIFGTWMRDDNNARVRVAPCGDAICATNVWIRDPDKQGEKVGDRLVFKIAREGSRWAGTAHDPQRGLSFKASLNASASSMTTEGCMVAGMICRTTKWERQGRETATQ